MCTLHDKVTGNIKSKLKKPISWLDETSGICEYWFPFLCTKKVSLCTKNKRNVWFCFGASDWRWCHLTVPWIRTETGCDMSGCVIVIMCEKLEQRCPLLPLEKVIVSSWENKVASTFFIMRQLLNHSSWFWLCPGWERWPFITLHCLSDSWHVLQIITTRGATQASWQIRIQLFTCHSFIMVRVDHSKIRHIKHQQHISILSVWGHHSAWFHTEEKIWWRNYVLCIVSIWNCLALVFVWFY